MEKWKSGKVENSRNIDTWNSEKGKVESGKVEKWISGKMKVEMETWESGRVEK